MSSDFYFFTIRTTKSLQATTDTPVLETHREMSKIAEETNGIYSLQWGIIIIFSLCVQYNNRTKRCLCSENSTTKMRTTWLAATAQWFSPPTGCTTF